MTNHIETAKRYAEALQEKFNADRNDHMKLTVTVDKPGRKFVRIVQKYTSDHGSGRSVHAFVELATGKLIKAAGWTAPQKDKSGLAYRADLSTPVGFADAVSRADFAGSYLYAR